jgi:hypothetical protein
MIAGRDTSSEWHAGRIERGLRLRVRIRQRVLDREIAAGLRLDSDAARAVRAQQLTGTTERCRVARSLANVLQAADERHAHPVAPVGLNHAHVLSARYELLALIEILRGESAVAARGVALARELIESSASPVLRANTRHTVREAVSEAIAAL